MADFGRKGHEPDDEIELSLKSAFIYHEMLAVSKEKRIDVFIKLARETEYSEEELKRYIRIHQKNTRKNNG